MSATLNPAQIQAVNHLNGPCLVLAGAGSGKTRVITHKIGRLIQAGLEPQRIAAITFTNKAAAEMRERAKGLIGRDAKSVLICTFHALGVRMMRQDGAVLGLKPQFSILDSDDVTSLLKDCGGTTDAATARVWQWTISRWKNSGLNAQQALAAASDDGERQTAVIMGRYEERLSAFQSVDFDDLIGLPLKLLEQHPEVRARWQQALGHVLVDEYQDTNATQYTLLKHLVGERARFTAVGDDDQSIYGWRGATLDNLRKLPEDYPQLKIIKLEQNYRSTAAILRAANNVIAPNPKLFPKTLFSELGEGEPVRVVDSDNEEHEAERMVARIQSLRANGGVPAAVSDVNAAAPGRPKQGTAPSGGSAVREATSVGAQTSWRDFSMLYRANHMAKPLEKALRRAQIPYKVSGGQSFFDRAEIKDLCAWFRLWVNERDDPAFLRAITSPKRGIGHQTLQSLGTFASQYRLSLFGALFSHSLSAALPARAVAGLHEFGRFVNDQQYRARHTHGAESARAFLTDWLRDIGYEQHLHDGEDNDKVAAARWSNVLDFCDWMAGRCGGEIEDMSGAGPLQGASAPLGGREDTSVPSVGARHSGVTQQTEKKSLLEVAQTISLLSTLGERDQDPDVVTLSTLHAAKGLEWPHVMLIGVNEGLLPFRIDEGAPADADDVDAVAAHDAGRQMKLEEERRLMYVGITRAQRTLAVSWTQRRKKGRETVPAKPSRFIAEMALDQTTVREDPREKLRALRAEFAKKAEAAAIAAAGVTP